MTFIPRVTGAALALVLAACAGHPTLTPLAPDRASAQVAAAKRLYDQQHTPESQLELGIAQYRAGDDTAARATLHPLLAGQDEVGARASLYDAAAAEREADFDAARQGYVRYLARHDDASVHARLDALTREEAVAAAKAAVAGERSLAAASLPDHTVGVAPLVVARGDSSLASLGYGLADLLITDLSRSAQLRVVDRVRTDALLQELRLAGTGRVDAATAPRVGKLIGARNLVNGALAGYPNGGIGLSAAVADAEKGTLVGRPIDESTSLERILDTEKSLAFALFTQLGVTLTPAERAAVEQRPTRYLAAFLAYCNGARAEALGDYRAARAYYAQAVMIDPSFSIAGSALASVSAAADAGLSAPGPLQTGAVPLPPPPTPNGVLDAVNPSPAGTLGAIRDRGDASQRATIESGVPGAVNIPVYIP